ncbi:MAG: precorrin-3B synthase [Trebonia sp.]|nr:precorrin-3B synthase [Trebonia sp.]
MHETSPFTGRPAADRCPGVLRLAEAADGLLARVRLPGGLIDAAQLRVLARLAGELGDGRIELTSRGNVQVRGLAAGAASPLTSELIQAGLLPSLSHDRVRNVLASPLAGLDRGPDLTGVVRALDAALCVRPRLAELSGRFLFAVDDGRGDVAGLGADVVATIRTDGAVVNGLSVRGLRDAVVAAMIACAEAFLDRRAALGSSAWRIADLPGGAEPVRSVVAARLGLAAAQGEPIAGTPDARAAARPVGLVVRQETGGGAESAASVRDDPGFSAVLLAPLGRLTSAQVSWVADRVAGRAARITPWRSVVLPDLVDAAGVLREAAGLGFGTDEASPWLRVTACAGRPGCASALADVQADAAAFAARWPGRLVHVSGCARHCGRPAATEIDVTATSEGYQVAGV